MTSAVATLVAQSNCPICGSQITSGGGGVAFASATFACGCELQTANGQIVIGTPCPAPSYVAVRALNKAFDSQMPTPPGNQIRTAECDGEDAVPVTGQLPVGTASNPSIGHRAKVTVNPHRPQMKSAEERAACAEARAARKAGAA